jgi:hypothetical protein
VHAVDGRRLLLRAEQQHTEHREDDGAGDLRDRRHPRVVGEQLAEAEEREERVAALGDRGAERDEDRRPEPRLERALQDERHDRSRDRDRPDEPEPEPDHGGEEHV